MTLRARDIKPGEQVDSVWDAVQKARVSTWFLDNNTKQPTEFREPDSRIFYNEADILEDAILFPEQTASETDAGLFHGHETSMQDFMSKGPDWARFIKDLDTDEEFETSEAESEHDLEDKSNDEKSDEEVNEHGEEDIERDHVSEDSSWEDCDDEDGSYESHIMDSLPITQEEKQDLALLKNWESPKARGENVEKEFYTFLDREKSKGKPSHFSMKSTPSNASQAFKRSWHEADLEPGAKERYREATILIDQISKFVDQEHKFRYIRDLHFLGVHPYKHRRVVPDMLQARGMMALFFPTSFFESESGILHKDSLIINQSERVKHPPNRRTHASNKSVDKQLFEEWDAYWKPPRDFNDYPLDWDKVTRPIIAKLYKTGVIQNAYTPDTPGRAMAATEPGRRDTTRDFYIDLRVLTDSLRMTASIQPPPSPDHLLQTARAFAHKHEGARFAILRLWSAPHFYPLMVGLENRVNTQFTDGLGRAWEFCFVPKDMPGSEYSVHHAARLRLLPFEHLLMREEEKVVVVMRDLFLVMGSDEGDLERLAVAVTFAIQTDPWRLEVDLWRSFVNVDLGFLEGLRGEWLV